MKILDSILSYEHRRRGLNLHNDGVLVYLFQNGNCIKKWPTDEVTVKEIHEEADKCLGGDAVEELLACGGIEIIGPN